jgi:two-component system, LytTR family, sensor kinase
MQTAPRRDFYNWFWIASLWAGLAILDATQNVFAMRHEGMHHVWMKVFIVLTIDWLSWAAIRRLGSRR